MQVPSPISANSASSSLSDAERRAVIVMIVDSDKMMRQHLRHILMNLGYANVTEAPDHAAALARLEQRPCTHIIFEAKRTNMPAAEFLNKVLAMDAKVVAIPSSIDPTVDDVFGLLCAGARGYIVRPFNEESVEDSLCMATKGEPISESILYAKDRNEALASLVMTSLDKLATVLRQAVEFETARREIPKRVAVFRRSVDIARMFAEGGEDELLEAIVAFCEERGNGPATRLGRIRERLRDRIEHKHAGPMSAPSQADQGEPT